MRGGHNRRSQCVRRDIAHIAVARQLHETPAFLVSEDMEAFAHQHFGQLRGIEARRLAEAGQRNAALCRRSFDKALGLHPALEAPVGNVGAIGMEPPVGIAHQIFPEMAPITSARRSR